MVLHGLKLIALSTLLNFSTYLRLVESRTLRILDVVPAVTDAAHSISCTVLLPSPHDRDGLPATAGGYDEEALPKNTRMPYRNLCKCPKTHQYPTRTSTRNKTILSRVFKEMSNPCKKR